MLIKYEFRRAFNRSFFYALFLGIISGIGGIVSYFFDTQWNDVSAISCYDAWLYCLSVSEASIYRAIFPIIITLPYLATFYNDRNTNFIFLITSRIPYSHYLAVKIGVGTISAMAVVIATLVFWLCICFVAFPSNLPTTVLNYIPKGAFSQYFVYQPIKYIGIVMLINIITGALFYLMSMVISFYLKNRKLVILVPFVIYLLLIVISQINSGLSFLNPVPLVSPLEAPKFTFGQIVFRWAIILIICFVGLKNISRVDSKEIL